MSKERKETKIKKILSLYETGMSVDEVMEETGFKNSYIRKVLSDHGVYDMPTTKHWWEENGGRWDATRDRIRKAAGL